MAKENKLAVTVTTNSEWGVLLAKEVLDGLIGRMDFLSEVMTSEDADEFEKLEALLQYERLEIEVVRRLAIVGTKTKAVSVVPEDGSSMTVKAMEMLSKLLYDPPDDGESEMFDQFMLEPHVGLITGGYMPKKSPFTKGRADIPSGGGGRFISLKDGEAITFAPMLGTDGMISANMHEYWDIRPAIFHPCIGKNCPGCAVGNEYRFKGYLPVYTKEGEVAIFPFTVSVYRQLTELEDELDDRSLKGYVIKLKRDGSGFNTKYTVIGLGKRIDVSEVALPEFVESLGPTTEEDIIDLLRKNDVTVPGMDSGFSGADGEPDGPYDEPTDESTDDGEDPWGGV